MITNVLYEKNQITYNTIHKKTYLLNKKNESEEISNQIFEKNKIIKMYKNESHTLYYMDNDTLFIDGLVFCHDPKCKLFMDCIENFKSYQREFRESLCINPSAKITNVTDIIFAGKFIICQINSAIYIKYLSVDNNDEKINFYIKNNKIAPYFIKNDTDISSELHLFGKIICPKNLRWSYYDEGYFCGVLNNIFYFVFGIKDILHYHEIDLSDENFINLSNSKIIFHRVNGNFNDKSPTDIYITTNGNIWAYNIFHKNIIKFDVSSFNNIVYPIFSSINELTILSGNEFYFLSLTSKCIEFSENIESQIYKKISDKISDVCRDLPIILFIHESTSIDSVVLDDGYLFVHKNASELQYYIADPGAYCTCSFLSDKYLYVVGHFDDIELSKIDIIIDASNYLKNIVKIKLSDNYLSHKIISSKSIVISFTDRIIDFSIKKLQMRTIVNLNQNLDSSFLTKEFNRKINKKISIGRVIYNTNTLNLTSLKNLFDRLLNYMSVIDDNTSEDISQYSSGNLLTSGDGFHRHLVKIICIEIESRFLIKKGCVTIFNRQALSELTKTTDLFYFGKLLHWLIHLNGGYLPIRLPIELLKYICKMNFRELCTYANMVDSYMYNRILPYIFKEELFEKLESDYKNPKHALKNILFDDHRNVDVKNLDDIAIGFMQFGSIDYISSFNSIINLDAYVSGPYQISSYDIVKRLNFSHDLLWARNIFIDIITETSPEELNIFMENIGGTTCILNDYHIRYNTINEEKTSDIKYMTCSVTAFIKQSVMVGDPSEIKEKLKILLFTPESMMLD